MIRSMTGFAAVSREDASDKVNLTVKSVNHRFLDTQIKMPSSLASLESRIKAVLQQRLARGRIEVSLFVERTTPAPKDVVIDDGLVERVAQAVEAARARGLVTGGLTASDLLRIPQAIEVRTRTDVSAGVSETLTSLVEGAVQEAIDALIVMRATEGRFLEDDLEARVGTIGTMVDELERLARTGQEDLGTRLRERLAALPADLAADPAALAQEVVRFVARSDVDEEVVRMRGHLAHWRGLVEGPEPCGRKLDFLLQEMNREINTIGSKAEGPRATETVVAAKAELERLKEQVQNVE
ncbi:MAG TPA: YicC/YloC family endoribonuclease [Vicinamibacterales bacterium]|nr:YicC/YloC family endoribonuclease [Vicinamibacterales bacterium]